MSGVVGTAVSDRMKYGVKPSAVKTENLLHNIKATTGHNTPIALGNEVIFEIPSMGNGYYCDLGNSYFRFGIGVSLSTAALAATRNIFPTETLKFERGFESIFRRIQITDASGNLLENLEHYNELYALQEICTAPRLARDGIGYCNGEGFDNSMNNPASGGANFNDGTVSNALCTANRYSDRKGFFPDLGSIILTSNPFQQKKLGVPNREAQNVSNNIIYYTFQISSAIFGGMSEKYIPMSAINGIRIVMALENLVGSVMSLNSAVTSLDTVTITIKDPTYFLNMIRVDPTVDQQLISSATGPDGMIRVHSQTWSTFSQSIAAGVSNFDYLIPIRVSSLKAIFFGFTRNYQAPGAGGLPANNGVFNGTYGGQLPADGAIANAVTYLTDAIADTYINNMKSSWFMNNIGNYQFFIDGRPSPATPVLIKRNAQYVAALGIDFNGTSDLFPSEAVAELARAWHVGHKTFDNIHMSTMFSCAPKDYMMRNCIFGHEFESFSSKSSVIESGYNTLNASIQLRLAFDGTSTYASNLRMYCLYDVFTVIDPQTGIIRTEF